MHAHQTGRHAGSDGPAAGRRPGSLWRAVDTAASASVGHCACGGGCPRCRSGVALSTPGDRWEREADRAADHVLAGAAVTGLSPVTGASDDAGVRLDRVAATVSPMEEEGVIMAGPGEDEELGLQRQHAGGEAAGAADLPARLAARRGRGRPLPAPQRGLLEQRFGRRFGDVRLHADAEAAGMADSVAAHAFTWGSDIYLGPGSASPETKPGLRLLAHELAHVVQQGGAAADAAPVQRMSVLNQTTRQNVIATNVAPWGPPDPRGSNYRVYTDAGSEVPAWVAYGGYPGNLRYWCHGHSLGTYDRWIYSVYSGAGAMGKVIADDYQAVSPANTRAGDLAVWLPKFDHSAVFTSPVVSGGALDESASRLSTKNGQASQTTASLTGIMGTYGNGYGVFRHR